MSERNLTEVVSAFANQLAGIVEEMTASRVASIIKGAFAPAKRGPGRPPKNAQLTIFKSARTSRPRQICPVPGCKNTAAPVFGMVCKQHKDLSKTKIRKYREQRRKAKAA
jgi:hypothetical protein